MKKRATKGRKTRRRLKPRYFVHPKALVDPGAVIGDESRIWAFAHVLPGAIIGSSCNICDGVFIESGATVGNDVTVKCGVSIWEGIHVEDGVFLGPSCVFTNDRVPRSFLKRKKADWLEQTHLREGSTIGANATVVCGLTIGRFAFVSAGAVVTKNVPDHAMVAGIPARFHAWICRCGAKLTLRGRSATCAACGCRYERKDDGLVMVPPSRATTTDR